MLDDQDKRVVPAVLSALARLKAPDARRGAARAAQGPPTSASAPPRRRRSASSKPAGGAAALRDAYRAAQADPAYDVRDGGR